MRRSIRFEHKQMVKIAIDTKRQAHIDALFIQNHSMYAYFINNVILYREFSLLLDITFYITQSFCFVWHFTI